MNKVQGLISEFVPVREEGTRIVISYGLEAIGEEKATWVEVYLPKKKNPMLTLDVVKEAIIADIDSQTDEKILTGFVWEDNEGVERHVWLSRENQSNYSEAQRLADKKGSKNYQPKTFKISEDEDKKAFYRTFNTLDELNEFYFAVYDYIEQTLGEGWIKKDSIDFEPYEAFFNKEESETVSE